MAYDHEIVEMFIGNESGKSVECRQEFQRVLDRLRAGDAEGLLVLKLDRLARSTRDGADLLDEFFGTRSKYGLTLLSVQDYLNTDTAAGVMMFNILLSFAQYERDLASERTRAVLQYKMKNGHRVSKRIQYGWQVDPRDDQRLIEHPEEQAVIARMRELEASGRSMSAIAQLLNDEEIPTKLNGAWYPATVDRVLHPEKRRARRARTKKSA